MKIVVLLSLVLFATFVNAKVVNVADYGIVPGKDATYELNNLIENLKGHKGVTLFFPKGTYVFKPENAIEKYRAVTNHDNSLKRLAFPLFGVKDFTIDGNGSTFLFHGRICPITIESSHGVTLKNFSIDWDTPFHHEIRVVESDPKQNTFVAEIYPMKYGFEIKDGELLFNHYNWQAPAGQHIVFDSKTKAPSYMTKNYFLRKGKSKVTKVSENRVRFENSTKVAPPVGSVICVYGPNTGHNRLAQTIHASNSTDIKIKNVTIYAGGGMGLIAERCENISMDGLIVTSTEERTLSTRADATHFLGCKGLIRMENCLLEHMADDGINVHGAYVKVNKYMGDNTFLCAISNERQMGLVFSEPGDKVMITSRETVLPIYETTIKDVKILNEERFVVTVTDVPEPMPTGPLSLENLTWYPDLVMKNNIIRNNRARSALISTKGKVLVENNYFSSQVHGILIEGDNKNWYESGGVRDVTINNNIFENIGYGSGEGYPLLVSPKLLPEQHYGDDQYHWNVRFTNNKVKSFTGLLVEACSVKNLEISGNAVEFSDSYPKGCDKPSIHLEFSQDVTIERNTFDGFDWPIHLEQDGEIMDLKQDN